MKKQPQIFYLSNERFPSKLACTIQQIAMCEAFASQGARVILIRPRYADQPRVSAEELFQYYGVKVPFAVQVIPSLLSLSKPLVDGKKRLRIPLIGGLSVYLSGWMYALRCALKGELKDAIIYSRSVTLAYAFLKLKKWQRKNHFSLVFEVHSLDQQRPKQMFVQLLKRANAVISISHALQKDMQQKFGVETERILVAADGVKEALLRQRMDKDEARAALGLEQKKLIVYTGQLLPGKGAEVFVAAASFIPDAHFLLVGGHGTYLAKLKKIAQDQGLTNVEFIGFVPPDQIPRYQAAGDVLVLPATANHEISAYTSPLKLFEYMASRRPIVASDLPVLQEILGDGENAVLFREGDAEDLADKVKIVLQNRELANRLAAVAWRQVHEYTWSARAKRILDFITGKESRNDNFKATQYPSHIH